MSLFTTRDPVEGKISISKIPKHLSVLLDGIAIDYLNEIPDKTRSTYHTWYDHMSPSIKARVEEIQNDPYWKELCDGSESCIRIGAPEMDELYYSNPKNIKRENLYGASGNYIIHKDCFFHFQGIRFYRILIGLTDGNDNVVTYFTNLKQGHKLNKGDVIAFDFDNTVHQVIKERDAQTPRIMLKLHYIVCDKGNDYSRAYVERIKQIYLYYEFITRYGMDVGTDPETWYEFFWGTWCMYSEPSILFSIIAIMTIGSLLILRFGMKIPFDWKHVGTLTGRTLLGVVVGSLSFFIAIGTVYWARYKLTGIK